MWCVCLPQGLIWLIRVYSGSCTEKCHSSMLRKKKNLKKVSFSITEGHDSISTTNGLFVCGSCLHFESSFVCQSACPPFPQLTSHIFLKLFLLQCSVIHNSFTTVSPDLLLNTFLLLPVYQVPSTCEPRDLSYCLDFILLIKRYH